MQGTLVNLQGSHFASFVRGVRVESTEYNVLPFWRLACGGK